MYHHALQRIKDEYRDLGYRILSWILHAHKPLTVVELQHALAFDGKTAEIDPNVLDDEVFMLSVCSGLVTTQKYGPYGDEDHTIVELGFVRELIAHLGRHSLILLHQIILQKSIYRATSTHTQDSWRIIPSPHAAYNMYHQRHHTYPLVNPWPSKKCDCTTLYTPMR
jgi:hypothetical protein